MSKVVAIIPARAGSKRLRDKNKMYLLDKPLFEHALLQALECTFIDEVVISTDDQEILEYITENYILNGRIRIINRPEYLATDDTEMWAVVEHAFQEYDDDTIIILLQPTNPTRTPENIRNAYNLFNFIDQKAGVIITHYIKQEKAFKLIGSVFIYHLGTIVNTRNFLQTAFMNLTVPYENSIDIDYIEDFIEAERLMKEREV